MSFDFKILVFNQKRRSLSKIPFSTSIQVLNEVEDYNGARYHSIWPFMTNSKGVWYSLNKEDELGLAYASFCSSDFSIEVNDLELPYWLTDKIVKRNLTPLYIKKEFSYDFERIIRFLIKKSPIKTIMILGSYQGPDHETICGTLTLDEYFTLMNEGKIYFNVCYIVREG